MNTLSLVSAAKAPCGIEAFARQLAELLHASAEGRHASLPISGRWRDVAAAWRKMDRTDLVIMNLHLAAWKRVILQPLLALILARLCGCDVLVILHEWSDLDWRRRLLLAPCLPLATRLLLSAPRVERQLGASPISCLITRRRGIVPIPPNLARPASPAETELSSRLAAIRRSGRAIVGQFGSIYPKKRNLVALDVAAELRRRGLDVSSVFVGDFVRGRDNLEEEFGQRVRALGLDGAVAITGYLQNATELFAVLDQIDVFVYAFADGLTSNRASVLTCLQAGKVVVVNAPRWPHELGHHPTFREQLTGDRLRFVATDADVPALATKVEEALTARPFGPLVDFRRTWSDVLDVVLQRPSQFDNA
jgi:glycosyltransferase involved in cell wall biosynthesis